MFPNIGTLEVLILAVVVLVLFGGKQLPEFARNMAEALKELRDAISETPEKPTKT